MARILNKQKPEIKGSYSSHLQMLYPQLFSGYGKPGTISDSIYFIISAISAKGDQLECWNWIYTIYVKNLCEAEKAINMEAEMRSKKACNKKSRQALLAALIRVSKC